VKEVGVFNEYRGGRDRVTALPARPAERSATRIPRGLRLAGAASCLAAVVTLAGCGLFSSSDDRADIGANNPEIGMAFGDSISHGRKHINDAGPDEPGYRIWLQKLFAARGHAVQVYEDGEPGTVSSQGLARIDGSIAVGPAFIVILYGTNDANLSKLYSEVIGNLRAMTLRCRANKIIVVLCTIPPVCDRSYQLAKIEEYNPLIRKLAAELGGPSQGVFLADLSQAFLERSPDPCLLINPENNIHPTEAGYALIAETVFGQLQHVAW